MTALHSPMIDSSAHISQGITATPDIRCGFDVPATFGFGRTTSTHLGSPGQETQLGSQGS